MSGNQKFWLCVLLILALGSVKISCVDENACARACGNGNVLRVTGNECICR